MSMVISNYIKLFYTGADRQNGICNKTRQRRVSCLSMSAKAYHRARYVRPVLIMGKARMRAGVQARKARINDGKGAQTQGHARQAIQQILLIWQIKQCSFFLYYSLEKCLEVIDSFMMEGAIDWYLTSLFIIVTSIIKQLRTTSCVIIIILTQWFNKF